MFFFIEAAFKGLMLYAVIGVVVFQPAALLGASRASSALVAVDRLNLRRAPSTGASPIKVLEKGTPIIIIEDQGDWLKISHGDQVGYIRNVKGYVDISETDKVKTGDGAADKSKELIRFKKQAEAISGEIKQHQAEVQTFDRKEASIINRLDEVDQALNLSQKRVAAIKSEIALLEKNIDETTAASEDLRQRIQTGEAYASKRLVALYKLERLGSLHVLAAVDSLQELSQRKVFLERILAHDETLLVNLKNDKLRLQEVLDDLRVIQKKKQSLEGEYSRQIRMLSLERQERADLLEEVRQKRSLTRAAVESLMEAARNLDSKMDSLATVVSLPADPAERDPKIFSAYKGLLNMPVQGKIISLFGPHKNTRYQVENYRNGIEIRAERGEPIHAVSTGRVLYANWLKGYGNMLIVDHGDNYYTVYAHAEELFKSKGDLVDTGEVIATVGDTGSIAGPMLYFEVRHHGKPIDPLEWVKRG